MKKNLKKNADEKRYAHQIKVAVPLFDKNGKPISVPVDGNPAVRTSHIKLRISNSQSSIQGKYTIPTSADCMELRYYKALMCVLYEASEMAQLWPLYNYVKDRRDLIRNGQMYPTPSDRQLETVFTGSCYNSNRENLFSHCRQVQNDYILWLRYYQRLAEICKVPFKDEDFMKIFFGLAKEELDAGNRRQAFRSCVRTYINNLDVDLQKGKDITSIYKMEVRYRNGILARKSREYISMF